MVLRGRPRSRFFSFLWMNHDEPLMCGSGSLENMAFPYLFWDWGLRDEPPPPGDHLTHLASLDQQGLITARWNGHQRFPALEEFQTGSGHLEENMGKKKQEKPVVFSCLEHLLFFHASHEDEMCSGCCADT